MEVSFGLHVGQTSCCLAVSREGRIDVVANDAGDRVTPAVVGWNEGEVLVGKPALQFANRKPTSVVKFNKQVLAASAPDIDHQVGDLLAENYGKGKNPDLVRSGGKLLYIVDNGESEPSKKVSPSSVQFHIYKFMHDIAASHATEDVDTKNTVLTVPHDYSKSQRDHLVMAAESSGFHVVQCISEPAAAVLAYSLGQLDTNECLTCLIYRCGGASLSVSLASVNSGIVSIQQVKTFDVGGNAITEVVTNYLAAEFQKKYKVDPRETKRGNLKLKTHAETVKRSLSTLDTSNCYIESLYEGIDFSFNVTRARFENELGKILSQFIDPIEEVLAAAETNASNIDKVILCGGTSKVPKLKGRISGIFPKAEILSSLSADEVLSVGAASQASLLDEPWKPSDPEAELRPRLTATSHSILFVSSTGDGPDPKVLIPAGCPIPTRKSHHLHVDLEGTDEEEPTCQISVKIFLKSPSAMIELLELTLCDLCKDSKVSLSAHIHRDGSVHFALTDKHSGICDQVSLQAPEVS